MPASRKGTRRISRVCSNGATHGPSARELLSQRQAKLARIAPGFYDGMFARAVRRTSRIQGTSAVPPSPIRPGEHAVQSRQSADRAGGSHDPAGSGQPAARRGPRRDRAVRRAGEEPRAHPHLPADPAVAVECRGGRDDGRGDGRGAGNLFQVPPPRQPAARPPRAGRPIRAGPAAPGQRPAPADHRRPSAAGGTGAAARSRATTWASGSTRPASPSTTPTAACSSRR